MCIEFIEIGNGYLLKILDCTMGCIWKEWTQKLLQSKSLRNLYGKLKGGGVNMLTRRMTMFKMIKVVLLMMCVGNRHVFLMEEKL